MKKVFIYLSLLSMVFGFMAFDCSSAELTGAKLYIQQKQFDKAKDALQKEVAKNPASDEGWYLLGTLYGEDGNYDKMVEAYDKSVSASPKFAQQVIDSKKYYWATSFNKGVRFFNQAVRSEKPDSAKIFFDNAIDMFKSTIIIEPDSISGYSNLAMVYVSAKHLDEAVVPLEKIIKIGKSPEAYSTLGQIYVDKGTSLKDEYKKTKVVDDSLKSVEYLNKAIQILEEGKAKFPDNSEILLRVSNAYIIAGKMDVAMNAFKEGVTKEPKNQYYRYNYGVVLLNLKQYENAIEQFKEAVSIDPEYASAIYNLAVSYVKWGAAIREIADKKAETADEPLIKEKFKAALPYLEKYLTLKPKEPTLWELLGQVYANLGMQDKANDAFKKAEEYKK
jgi:tetratricopeptide (TPR) repeat protein